MYSPWSLFSLCAITIVTVATVLRLELPHMPWSRWVIGVSTTVIILDVFSLATGEIRRKTTKNSPSVVTSWLPWIGHALFFGRTPVTFLKVCRLQYGPIYKFLVAGRYIVVLSTPTAISNFFHNSAKSLEVIEFQMIGVITGLPDLSRLPYLYSVVEHKALIAMAYGMTRRTFSPTAHAFNLDVHKRLAEKLGGQCEVTVSLLDFIQRSLYASNSVALLGPHFPLETCEQFIAFDHDIPMIIRQLPFLGRRGKNAREALVSNLSGYIKRCWREEDGGYLEGGSNVMSAVVRELKSADMSHSEEIRILNGFMWGSHSNLMRVTFWVMAYILTNEDAFRRIQREIRGAMAEKFYDMDAFLNMDPTVLDGAEFNLLSSAVTEVLRMTALPGSFREALGDITIQGDGGGPILIQKGEFVTADIRGMHFDPAVYEDPEIFKAGRFLDKEGTFKWPNEKSFSVFGGGSHMCKGRYYAIHTIRVFVILCFQLFDMESVSIKGSGVTLPKHDPTSFAPVVRSQSPLWVSLRRRRV